MLGFPPLGWLRGSWRARSCGEREGRKRGWPLSAFGMGSGGIGNISSSWGSAQDDWTAGQDADAEIGVVSLSPTTVVIWNDSVERREFDIGRPVRSELLSPMLGEESRYGRVTSEISERGVEEEFVSAGTTLDPW